MIFYKILHSILLKSKWEDLMPVRLPIKLIVRVNKTSSAVLSVIFIILYGKMTGFGVSTNRAVVMFFLSLLAGLVGRTYDFLTGILTAALVLLYQQPLYISDSGFWLSFGAVFGIALLLPELEAIFPEHKQNNRKTGEERFSKERMKKYLNFVCGKLRSGLLVSVAIFFMTFPIVIKTYYFYPLYGVFLNIFVIPLMGLLLPVSLFLGVSGMIFPIVSGVFSVIVDGILFLVEMLCTVTEQLPFAIQLTGQPSDEKIFVYYVLLGSMIVFWKQKRKSAREMSSTAGNDWKYEQKKSGYRKMKERRGMRD